MPSLPHTRRERHNFKSDIATRLPCGHILGQRCLYLWFDPSKGENNNTCPYCRFLCFSKFANEHSLEGIEERLVAFEWGLARKGRGPKAKERELLGALRARVVCFWLEEAGRELEDSRCAIERKIAEDTGVVRAADRDVDQETPDVLLEFHLRRTLIEGIKMQLQITMMKRDMEASHARERGAIDILGGTSEATIRELESEEIEEGEIVEEGVAVMEVERALAHGQQWESGEEGSVEHLWNGMMRLITRE